MADETVLSEIRAALAELGALGSKDAGTGPNVTLATGDVADLVIVEAHGDSSGVQGAPPAQGVSLVVADQLTDARRRHFTNLGWSWFDRRGHLRFQYRHTLIDADVTPSPSLPALVRRGGPFVGEAAMGIAIVALMRHPEPLEGVRATARALGVAASTASNAIARLVEAGLLTRDHHAVVPGLFWAAAGSWDAPAVGIAAKPTHSIDGVVLVGSLAASGLGAPAVITEEYPMELLATDERAMRRVIREYGTAPIASAPARVALAPTRFAATPGDVNIGEIEVAHPIVVALGLATDPARGTEIVRNWERPDRVW